MFPQKTKYEVFGIAFFLLYRVRGLWQTPSSFILFFNLSSWKCCLFSHQEIKSSYKKTAI